MFTPGVAALQNEGAYKVLAKAQAVERGDGPWSTKNKGVIHFEIGQPDYPTPEHIKNAGIDAIKQGKTTYTSPQGLLELRQSLCKHVKRTRGADVTPEEVVIGPGCKPALYFLAQALLKPGDELLYPDPGFPQYPAIAAVTGARTVPIPLDAECRTFQWDKFDAAISSGRAKVLITNSPSNPTGGVMPPEDVRRVAAACRKHGVWYVSDEIYSALTYDKETPAVSPLSFPECDRSRTVVLDGFSKTYCMTGWRLGWAVMPPALAERVALLITHAVGCTAAFTQWAGIAALEGPQACVTEMMDEYRKRRDYIVAELNKIPGVRCPSPQGAFYAFPDVSAYGLSADEVAEMLLRDGGVATLPGTDFGSSGKGHIRLSYVLSMDKLEAGMERIRTVLAKLPTPRAKV